MEYQINSKLTNKFRITNGKTRNKFKFEENKNNNKYPDNNTNNNLYDDKIIIPRKNNICTRLSNNLNSCKNFNNINNNKTFFNNKNNFNSTLYNRYKNDANFYTLEKNSSTSNLLNNRIKKVYINKGLNRNRSTAELLNKETIYILPAIKPRKIIIDYCCGQYDLQISNINKKNFNFKKYGHNTFFMGDNYNPQNYEVKQINRLSRNYYGKLFAN